VSDDPLAPALLVAMPQLLDPNFRRAVVLLLHHDAEFTFGLVLNRPSEIAAEGLCASLGIEWRGAPATLVDWGGPVQPNTGWVLLGDGAGAVLDEATQVTDELHFAGSLETLKHVASSPPGRLRLFLGYAGWGAGQLESELAQGAWIVAPVDSHFVFEAGAETLWESVLRDLGIDPATLVATPGVH
jgi:putative transcriptional regulator